MPILSGRESPKITHSIKAVVIASPKGVAISFLWSTCERSVAILFLWRHCERSVAIPWEKNAFIFLRLLRFTRDDN